MPRASAVLAADPSTWIPPTGWHEVPAGVWEPPSYSPSPWELAPPEVSTNADAVREYIRCASSLPYFALHYAWTLHVDDPDGARPRRLPAYRYVRELLVELQTPQNMLSEKSRQMLTSWIYMAAFLHDLLFAHNAPSLVASRRAREVDDGGQESTVDSLLGKLRYMHERLPAFLWHPFDYKLYLVKSTRTQSYVRGETGSGGQVARGPAYRRALMDEAAYAKHSESMFSGLRQACKTGLALNSTVNGRGNVFARLAHSQTTTFRKIRLHWIRHPEKAAALACLCGWTSKRGPGALDVQFEAHRKSCPRREGPAPTSPWYRQQQADLRPEQIASELDINYDRSTAARVFDGYDATRHVFDVAEQRHRRTGRIIGPSATSEDELAYRRRALAGLIDPRHELLLFWDFGVSDETYVALGQPIDARPTRQETRWLDEIVDAGKSWEYYHRLIVSVWYPAYLEALGLTPAQMRAWADRRELDWSRRPAWVPDLANELPRGCLPVYHAGDPAGRQRDSSLSSWTRNLANADPPMHLHTVPFAKPQDGSLLDWIDHVRDRARRDLVTMSSFCVRLADAFGGWQWPTDRDGIVLPGRQLPVHDKHSHPGTAIVMGYRTRWRGMLVTTDRSGKEAQQDLVVTETAEHSGRRFPEGLASRRPPRDVETRLARPRAFHEPDDDDDD
jgi:hypothetical protein